MTFDLQPFDLQPRLRRQHRIAAVTVYLDEILAAHRQMAADDERAFEHLKEEALACPPARGFEAALRRASAEAGPTKGAVIAEIKRRSPSKGDLRPSLDPVALARSYAEGGATCISVLTDQQYFGGSAADLKAAGMGCDLPLLRKDFTVDARDICDARIMGADAVLLIVSALDEAELTDFLVLARELGIDALVEIHTMTELELARIAGATFIGVNQRDLRTFEVDRDLALRLLSEFPEDAVKVAESAIGEPADAHRLFEGGFDAILVGESFVKSSHPAEAVASFLA